MMLFYSTSTLYHRQQTSHTTVRRLPIGIVVIVIVVVICVAVIQIVIVVVVMVVGGVMVARR